MKLRNDIIEIQQLINSGMAWCLEGHVGRTCMDALRNGDVMLGRYAHRDYWGNYVPARGEVKEGTLGSKGAVVARHGKSYALALSKIGDTFNGFID